MKSARKRLRYTIRVCVYFSLNALFSRCAPVALLSVAIGFAQPPASQAPQPQGQLDASPALFGVLAAINAAGYDEELNSPTNHPLRAAIRKYVQAKNPPSLPLIQRFFEAHKHEDRSRELSQYISFALATGGPPDFQFRFRTVEIPPDARSLEGFNDLMARFWKEADLDAAWRQAQPAIEEVIGRYHGPISQAVFQANAYLRNPTSGSSRRRFQVFVDLFGAPNQLHTRSYLDDYFVVITPSVQVRTEEIRHAYLHYLLDPLTLRFAKNLEKKRAIGDLAGASPILDEAYKTDFSLLAGMCLVKAVEARLAPVGERLALVDQAMRDGYILTAHFAEQLAVYEKQEQSMALYFPQMIDSIDLAREDKRIAQITFNDRRAVQKVKPAAPPPPPPLTGVAKMLESADALYRDRNLPGAKDAFRKVLEAEASRAAHARAWYGMARIALLEKDPETAEKLFHKAIEMDPEPDVRAWSHIYLGRLATLTDPPGDFEKEFQAALAVAGAPESAVNAAKKDLEAAAARIKQKEQE